MPDPEKSTKVKVIEVVGTKLEPGCGHILAFQRGTMTHADAHDLQEAIAAEFGVKCIMLDFRGNPQDQLRFFSVPQPDITTSILEPKINLEDSPNVNN